MSSPGPSLGRAKTAYPNDRIASTQPRIVAAAPGGITGVALLAESHFAVHTFPEHGALTLNLFCCRPRPDWDVAGEVGRFVAAPSFAVSVRRLDRALAP